jgi:hypothetical protein
LRGLALLASLLLVASPALAEVDPAHFEVNTNLSGNFTASETATIMAALETIKAEANAMEVGFEHPTTNLGCGAEGCHVQGTLLGFISPLHNTLIINPEDPAQSCGLAPCHPNLEDIHMFYSVSVETDIPESADDPGASAVASLVEFAKGLKDRALTLFAGLPFESVRANISTSGATEESNLLVPPVLGENATIPEWFIETYGDDFIALFQAEAEALSDVNTQLNRNEIYGAESMERIVHFLDTDMRATEESLGLTTPFAAALQGWDGNVPADGLGDLTDALAFRLPSFPVFQDLGSTKIWAGAQGQLQATQTSDLFENLAQQLFNLEDQVALVEAYNDVNIANPDTPSQSNWVARYYTAVNATKKALLIEEFQESRPDDIETRGFGGGFSINTFGGDDTTDPEELVMAIKDVIEENDDNFSVFSVFRSFDGEGNPESVSFSRSFPIMEVEIEPEDIDGNGVVDRADFNMVRSVLRQDASVMPAADLNGNGRIDVGDLRAIVLAFDCPRGICP